MNISSLKGIHPQIDQFLDDLSFFGEHLALRGFIPGNAGDISFLLSEEASREVSKKLGRQSRFYPFSQMSQLREIRHDGRHHYNLESFPEEIIHEQIQPLAGRLVIITATGAKLWDMERNPNKRLNIIEVADDCTGIYLMYGNEEYGTIPSIETPSHLVANAASLQMGLATSAALHCHPFSLVALACHRAVAGSSQEFNKVLYTQKEGVLTNISDLVGVVSYHPSGSRALLEYSINSIQTHRLTLWDHHGVLIREHSLERCVDILEYAEDAATAAVQSLLNPEAFQELREPDLKRAVQLYGLNPTILQLMETSE